MANGMQKKKPTVKEEKLKREILEGAYQDLVRWISTNFVQMNNEASAIRRQLEAVDTRLVAITRLLIKKAVFNDAEIKEAVEEVQIDTFNASAAAEDASLGLEGLDGPVGPGTTYIVQFETSEGGKRNAALSSIRSQVQFGTNQLPAEFEAQIAGLEAGDSKEFEIDAPKEFGPAYAGRKLTFKTTIWTVKVPKKVEESDSASAAAIAETPVEEVVEVEAPPADPA